MNAGTAPEAGLYVRDLGPLLVVRDGHARPVGGALATVLTLLLVSSGEPVSHDTIADALWGRKERSASTLLSHVSRLRGMLGPGVDGEPVLRRVNGGLLLSMPDEHIDSRQFSGLVERSRTLMDRDGPVLAISVAEQALALWRGRPFMPVPEEPWLTPVLARLEESLRQVRERWAEGQLALGNAERVLVELREQVAAHPLRERLWGLLMLAQYQTNRLDEALQTFHRVRGVLLDELGVEPSVMLTDLQARMLAGDPTLDRPRGPRADVPVVEGAERRGPPPRTSTLPNRRGRLIGRDDLLRSLQVLVRRDRVVTLTGAAGSGKTRLAIEVARAAVPEFPDGVWWADLTAAESADQVLDAVVSAIGIAPSGTGTPWETLLRYTSDRRMLLVLDNCEQVLDPVAHLVENLLAAGDQVNVLTTSREPLSMDLEVVRLVPPLSVEDGAPADLAPAVQLFVERLVHTTGVELSGTDLALARSVCRSVDGVPLAIELAAARARAYSLAEVAEQSAADPSALSRVGRGGADHHRTVRFAIEQSYRSLSSQEALLHRALSVVPGSFSMGLAAALTERPPDEIVDVVVGLVHRSMLVALGPAGPGRPSRFMQLATVRGHAAHASLTGRHEHVDRRDRWVQELVANRPRLGRSPERSWLAQVDDDLAAVRATLQHTLVDHPDPSGIQVATGLGMYWYYRGMFLEGGRWIERAAGVTDRAAPVDRVRALLASAATRALSQQVGPARAQVAAAMAVAAQIAPDDSVALGDAVASSLGPFGLARDEHSLRALSTLLTRVADRTGDPAVSLWADLGGMLGDLAVPLSPALVSTTAGDLWSRAQDADDHFTSRLCAGTVAILALGLGRLEEAMVWSDRQIAAHVALGLAEGPVVLEVRANVLARSGDAVGALRMYAAGQAHHRRVGLPWPQQPWTPELHRWAVGQLTPAAARAAAREGASLTLLDVPAVAGHPAVDR